MKIRYFQSLFVRAVVVLLVLSIVPVLAIGYRVTKINSQLLKNEILQKQQTIASRLASTVRTTVSAKEQLLAEFGDLRTDFGSHSLITQSDLDYLNARHPSLFYLAVFSCSKRQIFDVGTPPTEAYEEVKPDFFNTCTQGTAWISRVYYFEQKPFVWLTEPLHRKMGETKVTGVLAAAMYLDDIERALGQSYPLDMEAFVVSAQGDIVSYNGAPQGVDSLHAAQLRRNLADIGVQLQESENGEVTLPNGDKMLVSVVPVPWLDWNVYVLQPASVASQLFVDNLFHSSLADITIIALVMLGFVLVVSYLVIVPITRPLERLRQATIKLREHEDFVLKPTDVEVPHNEIGELASVFMDMTQTLHHRRQELMGTQQALAQMNQALEQRVEQRTRELKEATAELVKTERLAAIGQMASIISHEIRNPLAVISNSTRLIKTLVHPTDQKLIKQFGIIEAEIRQASSIISEVLGYARARDLILTMVDVHSYLHEIVLSFPPVPAITVQEKLEAPGIRIKVDAEEIKQALRNLISNAMEAMPNGGTLTVGAKAGERLVCLYVKDTGIGISEEIRREMFSPFFTTKARGTGLGLAVVRKSVTRHNGKLFIYSRPGEGACFQIYLKIYRKQGDTNYGTTS